MIDPRGMRDAREWADFATLPLQAIGATPRQLDNPDNWQAWAFNLIQSDAVSKQSPPDPRGFTDWMDWVFRFNQAVAY